MHTIQHTSPGSIGFSNGSDRSGQHDAGTEKRLDGKAVANWLVHILNVLAARQKRWDECLELQSLDERTLRDVGITRDQANAEALRISRTFKFWL